MAARAAQGVCLPAAEDSASRGRHVGRRHRRLTETRDRVNQESGAERLLALLRAGAGLAAETLVARLLDARRAFAAGDERDDVTVLVARGRETEAA